MLNKKNTEHQNQQAKDDNDDLKIAAEDKRNQHSNEDTQSQTEKGEMGNNIQSLQIFPTVSVNNLIHVKTGKKRIRETPGEQEAPPTPTKKKKTDVTMSPKKSEAVPKDDLDIEDICILMVRETRIDLRVQADIDQWIDEENNKKGTSPKKKGRDLTSLDPFKKMIFVINASGDKQHIQVLWGRIFKIVDNKVPPNKGTCAADIANWVLGIRTTVDD